MSNNDSHQHVVKTTSQWNDRAVEYWVVPRGCLCIELTPEGKTKLKVGEGNKFYHQLPYVCEGSDLSNYYTKEEIDNIIDNINRMAIMSTDEYDSKNDLPLDGNKLGDVRFVKSSTPSISTEPDIYLWNGTKWIFVGTDISSIDLDDFVKKEEFEVVKDKVDIMYPKMHEHTNKDVLDQTTAPFTIPEKEKLAGLENYDDTEIRELIHETGHTHQNKSLLDTITPSSLWNEADRIKFNDLHNYDDTEVIVRIETLEEKSHTHSNKNILDQTTAPFQVADKEKLDSLQNYDVFRGTDGIYPGGKGLVPGPTIEDSGKFLSSSGEWLYVTAVTNDFVGATATEDGEHGLVPAPTAGEQSYYLRGDGTWAKVKQGGDKYKAGDGIYILAGDASSTTLPVEIYAKANKLKQYVLYGGENPVGDWDSTLSKYAVVIKVSAEGMSDISTSLFLDDPIGNGDYIDYENQRFVHTRTNMTVSVRSGEWSEWINVDGAISNWHQDRMAPSDYIAVSSEYVYLYYPGDMHGCDRFDIPCYAALYDENKVFTRSILLRSFTEVTIEPQPGEAYMRVSYGYYQGATYRLTKIGEVITPIVLPPVIIYTNKVNTIDVMTANKPTEVYFETAVVEDTSEDPMSEYTGIIYNDGVLDITQEDPTALNELTVHFRESDKVITIPGNTYTAGDGIDIDANDEISTKLGSGLQFDANGAIEVIGGGTYSEGDAIKFEYEPVVSGDAVTHVKWSLLQTRGQSYDCIQVREFEMRNIDNELISFKSNVTGVFVPSSTTPVYGTSQTPDALVDGTSRKMCCTNFSSSITEFIFTMEPTTPVPMNRIKDYRYITAEDEPNRDPISWVLYVSTDGTNYIEVDRRINQTITQSRSTGTSYYTPSFPSTLSTTINVQYGDGLEVDNDNDLTVKLGTGLQFDTNGAIEAPGSRIYVAGDGITITDSTSFELSEDTVTNTEYFFDTQVTSNVSGRTFTKYNTEPALGAIVYLASSYSQPYFVGLTADSVKYRTDYDSYISPNPDHPTFEYKGVTWYYSGDGYAMSGDRTDSLGHMQKLPGSYSVSTEADLQNIAKAIIDAADIITDPTKIISAKIGEGLSFDANDAIQNEGLLSVTQDFDDRNHLTFGTAYGDIDIMIPGGEPAQYVRVSTNDSFLLLRTKPADWDDAWYRYYMLSYDELTVEPPDWDPTRHYKYENDNYVLGSPGDTFISTTWYDKHYNGLDPNTPVIFDSDVYYTGDLRLIEDGETYDTAFTKINEAIEHVERLEQNVQFLHDNKVDVRKTVDPERIEFYYS